MNRNREDISSFSVVRPRPSSAWKNRWKIARVLIRDGLVYHLFPLLFSFSCPFSLSLFLYLASSFLFFFSYFLPFPLFFRFAALHSRTYAHYTLGGSFVRPQLPPSLLVFLISPPERATGSFSVICGRGSARGVVKMERTFFPLDFLPFFLSRWST